MQSLKYAKVPDQKRCPMCEKTLGKSEFFKNCKDGLSPYCKPCSAKKKRKGDNTRAEMKALVYPSGSTKVCSKCSAEKDLGEFNERKRDGKSYRRPYCRECQSGIFKNWAVETGKQKFESRDAKAMASVAITYPSDGMKLCRGCDSVKHAEAFGARFGIGGICKECRGANDAKAYAENKADRQAYARRYRKENLHAVRAMALAGAKRRHLVMKAARAESRVTNEEKMILVATHGYQCMRCAAIKNISFDHIVPISKGGKDVIENLQLLCVPCNSSKARKTVDYRPPTKAVEPEK